MDYNVLINVFLTYWPLMETDIFCAMSGVLILCFIIAGATQITSILSSLGAFRGYASNPVGFESGGSGASTYQDQYEDSVRGARAGKKYVPGGGVEASVDPGSSQIGVKYKDRPGYVKSDTQFGEGPTDEFNYYPGFAGDGSDYKQPAPK